MIRRGQLQHVRRMCLLHPPLGRMVFEVTIFKVFEVLEVKAVRNLAMTVYVLQILG